MRKELLQQTLDALIPFARAHFTGEVKQISDDDFKAAGAAVFALHTAITQPVPLATISYKLTDKQLNEMWYQAVEYSHSTQGNSHIRFARAIEAAHTIKETK